MTLKINDPIRHQRFETMTEFLRYIERNPVNTYCKARSDSDVLFRGGTWQESTKWIRNGSPKAAKAIDRARQRVSALVGELMTDEIDDLMLDVAGSAVDLDMYLDGEPECMLQPIVEPVQPRVLSVYVSVSALSDVTVENMRHRGAAIAALVDIFEARDVRCEVHAVALTYTDVYNEPTVDSLPNTFTLLDVLVKSAGEPLNIDRVAYAIASPMMLRRSAFAWREHLPASLWRHYEGNYGISLRNEAVERAILAANTRFNSTDDVYLPTLKRSDKYANSEAGAAQFVADLANRFIADHELIG